MAHSAGQQEYAASVEEGLEAHKAGDDQTAVVKLGRAAQIAYESDDTARLKRLASVVIIEDAATGVVRMKPAGQIAKADEMELETRSRVTKRFPRRDQ